MRSSVWHLPASRPALFCRSNLYLFFADEEEVVGLCGLHKDYDTFDQFSTRNMYPWMASIVVQVDVSAVIPQLQNIII